MLIAMRGVFPVPHDPEPANVLVRKRACGVTLPALSVKSLFECSLSLYIQGSTIQSQMNMARRRFMTGLCTASLVAVAGCLSSAASENDPDDNDDDDDKDSEPILTGYSVSDQTVRPAVEHASEMDAWGVFVGSRSTAVDYFTNGDGGDAEALQTFLEETDFEAGDRLLYVEGYAPQTCYELVIDEEPKIAANGLPAVGLGVNRTAPDDQPCGDAITAVDSLLRLSFDIENGAPTDVIEVTVTGYKDDPEELLIEIDR